VSDKKIKTIGIKMPALQKWNVYIFSILLAVTGLWWTLLHEVVISKNLKLMHQLTMLHGIVALFCLIIFGSVITQHVRLAWITKRNRISGGLVFLSIFLIALTGLGLYYANEDLHDFYKWVHLALGIAAIILMPLHIVMGRKRTTK
jgi:hypothetical protein